MDEQLANDIKVGVKTYYNTTDKVAGKVAKKITPWIREQLTKAGITVPPDGRFQEAYSLLLARLVQSEVTAAVVVFEK